MSASGLTACFAGAGLSARFAGVFCRRVLSARFVGVFCRRVLSLAAGILFFDR